MDNQKLVEQKYMEMQMVSEQLERLRKQLHSTDDKLGQVDFVIASLQEFGTVQAQQEILIPITDGVFAKAILQDTKELFVNVGAGTVVNKDVPSTIQMLERQKVKLSEYRTRLAGVIEKFYEKTESLQAEMRAIKV